MPSAGGRGGVAHQDMKPDNMLLDRGGGLKLADFESAKCFKDRRAMRALMGMPYYGQEGL